MATNVLMPQLGESIAEGTIVRWNKRVGDRVDRDEPLFEVATDKVDAEVPSPVGGVVIDVRVAAGETVPVDSVVAVVGAQDEAPAEAARAGSVAQPGAPVSSTPSTPSDPATASTRPAAAAAAALASSDPTASPPSAAPPPAAVPPGMTPATTDATSGVTSGATSGATAGATSGVTSGATADVTSGATADVTPGATADVTPGPAVPAAPGQGGGARLSPVVRKLAREHGIDPADVTGTGAGGRVTRDDILRHVAAGGTPTIDAPPAVEAAAPDGPASRSERPAPAESSSPAAGAGSIGDTPAALPAPPAGGRVEPPPAGGRVEPLSVMRRQIAEHMIRSRRTSAHAHTVFEVDFERVAALRAAHGPAWAARGVRLTYLAFVAQAVAEALVGMPRLNASLTPDGAGVVHPPGVHLGIAVAIDGGLVVPVVRDAAGRSVPDLSRAIADLAERARTKRLSPDEVRGGTFTITNPGAFGSLFGMPIIHQPQAAILCLGAIARRPAVVEPTGAIEARRRAWLTLGFDHRLLDGADADRFLAAVSSRLESADGRDL